MASPDRARASDGVDGGADPDVGAHAAAQDVEAHAASDGVDVGAGPDVGARAATQDFGARAAHASPVNCAVLARTYNRLRGEYSWIKDNVEKQQGNLRTMCPPQDSKILEALQVRDDLLNGLLTTQSPDEWWQTAAPPVRALIVHVSETRTAAATVSSEWTASWPPLLRFCTLLTLQYTLGELFDVDSRPDFDNKVRQISEQLQFLRACLDNVTPVIEFFQTVSSQPPALIRDSPETVGSSSGEEEPTVPGGGGGGNAACQRPHRGPEDQASRRESGAPDRGKDKNAQKRPMGNFLRRVLKSARTSALADASSRRIEQKESMAPTEPQNKESAKDNQSSVAKCPAATKWHYSDDLRAWVKDASAPVSNSSIGGATKELSSEGSASSAGAAGAKPTEPQSKESANDALSKGTEQKESMASTEPQNSAKGDRVRSRLKLLKELPSEGSASSADVAGAE